MILLQREIQAIEIIRDRHVGPVHAADGTHRWPAAGTGRIEMAKNPG